MYSYIDTLGPAGQLPYNKAPNACMNIYAASNICMNISGASIICKNICEAPNIWTNIHGASKTCMHIYGVHYVRHSLFNKLDHDSCLTPEAQNWTDLNCSAL